MLIAPEVETGPVISRVIRFASLACCALVVMSFAMFARDQMAGASEHQQTELVAGTNPNTDAGGDHPSPLAAAPVHRQRGQDAHVAVLGGRQVEQRVGQRGLPAVIALLVYGVGLGYLARFASVH